MRGERNGNLWVQQARLHYIVLMIMVNSMSKRKLNKSSI